MGRPDPQASVTRDTILVVWGKDIRDYVDQLNLTGPNFAIALAKEPKEEIRNHIQMAHYELCALNLGWTEEHRLMVEQAIAATLHADIAFEQVMRVEFDGGETTVIVV